MLGAIGVITNLNATFFGITILAVGNAQPDALTTISMCKKGEGMMAISGAYAGQLFGLLVGFGLSMLMQNLKVGAQKFDLLDPKAFKSNILSILVVGTTSLVLLQTFVYGIMNEFKFGKKFAIALISIYITFISTCCYFGIKEAFLTY